MPHAAAAAPTTPKITINDKGFTLAHEVLGARIDGLGPGPARVVRAAAVVGQPDAARGEIPVAFVEVDDAFDADAALATLRERLASWLYRHPGPAVTIPPTTGRTVVAP